MALELHNTLTGKKEPFRTREEGRARVYVCGPTVYDYAHLGHARAYVVFDVLVRHLRASDWRVDYVRNVTDIDDKIIHRAKEAGDEPATLAERFTRFYREDMHRLGNIDPDVEPKVSEHLDDIRAMIGSLLERGHAYESDGDVYFDVRSFRGYGKLSHRDIDQLEANASGRISDEEARRKRNPADFALWKKSPEGEAGWDSPWSRGRPGWHIECSAMSTKYLGETFDLHGGGLDLVFPHHENEIAQSEAASGKPFVTTWVHNGFVEVDKEKMSKSLGNFFTVRQLFERFEPEAIRYVMLTRHYRGPINLEWNLDDAGHVTGFPQFEEAERRVEYLYTTLRRLQTIPLGRIVPREDEEVPPEILHFGNALADALDDDLNTPVALARTSELARSVNELCDQATGKKGKVAAHVVDAARSAFDRLARVLGVTQQEPKDVLTRIRDRRARAHGIDPATVESKIADRTEARKSKDFTRADGIRDELAEKGVELHDGPDGTTWTMH